MTTQQLLALEGLVYENDDGESRRLKLRPPPSPAQRQRLAEQLPPVLCRLLEVASGIDGAEHVSEGIDFTGGLEGQVLEEFLPDGITLAVDGCGNGWSLEPATGRIFFLCHDPPVVVLQSLSLQLFLEQLKLPPARSELGDALQHWTHRIWRENPCEGPPRDESSRSFLEALGSHWRLVDLREARPGDGFSWGKYGPQTEVRRHPELALVALSKPAAKPSLWSRWFGRP